MFLKQTKNREGRTYLSIVEGYRVNGAPKQRTVEGIGFLDALEKDYDDPVAHFKAYAKELTLKKKGDTEAAISFSPTEKIDKRSDSEKIGLGSVALSFCYHALQLDRFWNARKVHARLAFDPNAVFRMLVYQRVLRPGSKMDAYEHKDELPDRCSFSLDNVYQALSLFAKHEDAFKAHIDHALAKIRPRNIEKAYYDVTNYYFEIEDEDTLRRRGVSKEHKPAPIVQMGLMMDEDGLPIDYELYPGNTNDCLTMPQATRRVKERHPGVRMVIVADKGLNTSANIAEAVANGDGFVFSQSVRRATKQLKAWVLDETDYERNSVGTFKVKSRQACKKIRVKGKDGKTRSVEVDVQEVAFWSKDFADHSRYEREKVIEKSMHAMDSGEITSAKSKTKVRYVKDTAYCPDTGQEAVHAYSIDWDKIKQDEALDGYYCIVTSEVFMDEREVIDVYRQLWRIEETFRVTKSTLEVRPVYVSREERIRAHFMTCYAALVALRMLERALDWKYSADKIANELASLVGYREDANWYLFAHRSDVTDEIGDLIGIPLNLRRYKRGDIKQMVADSRKLGYGIWLKN